MFRSSNFEKNLDNATSHIRLEPDWPSILLICDEIRQNDVTPKQAIISIKKKMSSPNPHTASYALLVLESIVKNCGSPIHDEISTKENCEMFTTFIETTTHENVKTKMLELIQAWAFAFRSYDKYQAIKDTMTILKAKGHKFPELKEADAMFTSDTAPKWLDGKVCHRCRVPFTLTQRKHHCRNCGQVFCAQCSAKSCTLPHFGIEKDVRVCEGCYATLRTSTVASGVASAGAATSSRGGSAASTESDLPAEYLNSSLAQQSQSPPRKTEQELKEEEELQLALALSQSEAEQKSRLSTASYRPIRKSPSPDATVGITTGNSNNTPPYNASSNPPAVAAMDDTPSDPELAKYLNRDYWENRKTLESPASPSAPSPMSQTSSIIPLKSGPEDIEIDEFSSNMRTQVEIFVNRMKSNSSRGRNIVTDSSVQTLFMTLTSFHSRLLTYIKEMDDKRMWFEQLQDKLAQVKDSRAALDVLRQEHQEKLRLIAEEQERQRQLQMAHKLDIMRKKKQEYLQYQRQLAVQRIQEQEREMQMRQEQQKALYQMGGGNYQYMGAGPSVPQGSPIHQMVGGAGGGAFAQYGYQAMGRFGPPGRPSHDMYQQQQQQGGLPPSQQPPGMVGMPGGVQRAPLGHLPPGMNQMQQQPGQYMGGVMQMPPSQGPMNNQGPGGMDGQQQHQHGMVPPNQLMQQQGIVNQVMPNTTMPNHQHPQHQPQMNPLPSQNSNNQPPTSIIQQTIPPNPVPPQPVIQQAQQPQVPPPPPQQQQQPVSPPQPTQQPQEQPVQAPPAPAEAELISFD